MPGSQPVRARRFGALQSDLRSTTLDSSSSFTTWFGQNDPSCRVQQQISLQLIGQQQTDGEYVFVATIATQSPLLSGRSGTDMSLLIAPVQGSLVNGQAILMQTPGTDPWMVSSSNGTLPIMPTLFIQTDTTVSPVAIIVSGGIACAPVTCMTVAPDSDPYSDCMESDGQRPKIDALILFALGSAAAATIVACAIYVAHRRRRAIRVVNPKELGLLAEEETTTA